MIDYIVEKNIRQNILRNERIFENLRDSSILVTGATGLIGSQLVMTLIEADRLYNLNLSIYPFVRSLDKAKAVFGDRAETLKIIVGDVNQGLLVDDKIDYIIHGASVTDSLSFIQKPADTIQTAIQGTTNILEFAKLKRVKSLVYLSSLEVYGTFDGRKDVSETDFGYLDPAQPRSSYSESKRLAETLCVAYSTQHDVPIKIARLCQTFGAGVSYQDNRVFAQFARAVIEQKDIVLHTEGTTERSYCSIPDAISGILYILLKGTSGEAYNVSNEDTMISIFEMAKLVSGFSEEKKTKVVLDIKDSKNLGYNPVVKLRLLTSKLNELGWKAHDDLQTMIDDLIKSMVNRRSENCHE